MSNGFRKYFFAIQRNARVYFVFQVATFVDIVVSILILRISISFSYNQSSHLLYNQFHIHLKLYSPVVITSTGVVASSPVVVPKIGVHFILKQLCKRLTAATKGLSVIFSGGGSHC